MNFQSMKFRIIALAVALGTIGIMFRLMLALPFTQEHLRAQVESQQLSVASYVAHDIDHSIVARRALAGALASALPPELLRQPKELAAWVEERQRLNPMFDGALLVLHPDRARLLAGYPAAAGGTAVDFSGSAWFQAALAATAPVMSPAQRGPRGEPVIIVAAAVRDAQQRVVAVLAGIAMLNAPGFLDGLQSNHVSASGDFQLISPNDKLYVGASERSIALKPTPAPGVNPLHDRAMAGYRGSGIMVTGAGAEQLASIVSVPSAGWFLVALLPTVDAFRPIQVLRSFTMKSSAVLLVIVVTLLWFLLSPILRPLTDAAHAMREMADGKRELAPLPLPVRSKDEVGSLVLGFNYLVARLREKDAALMASEARMKFMAHHDPLTGLCNRAMLEDRLQQALARAERDGRHFALLFCDLDGFKPINDEYGHGFGDAVLVEVAARLSEGRRKVDTVARLGGDEFVVLLADLDDPRDGAGRVAAQCLAALAAPYQVGASSATLSVSIGVAWHQGAPVSSSQLMSQADIAMYRAKRAGKNAVHFFDEPELSLAAAGA
jgi:diguanylate cyclase (GGDEF)-like protein